MRPRPPTARPRPPPARWRPPVGARRPIVLFFRCGEKNLYPAGREIGVNKAETTPCRYVLLGKKPLACPFPPKTCQGKGSTAPAARPFARRRPKRRGGKGSPRPLFAFVNAKNRPFTAVPRSFTAVPAPFAGLSATQTGLENLFPSLAISFPSLGNPFSPHGISFPPHPAPHSPPAGPGSGLHARAAVRGRKRRTHALFCFSDAAAGGGAPQARPGRRGTRSRPSAVRGPQRSNRNG